VHIFHITQRPQFALIRLIDIKKEFQSNAKTITAVNNLNLNLETGSFTALTGKSGSGKSTLLNLISGLDRPTSGKIVAAGQLLNDLSENQLSQWRAKNVGIVFQFFQLLPTLTAVENVMLPMELGERMPWKARRQRGESLLEQVGLADRADDFPSQLSGGQQQRIAIARALANEPPLILADEPTGNLDSETAVAIFDLFAQLSTQGKTLLLATHDLDFASFANQKITLIDGQIKKTTM